MGLIVLFWGDMIVAIATGMLTVPIYPLYWRTMGILAMTLGALQIVASTNPQRYIIIPVAGIFVRLFLPILTTIQVIDTPSMALVLIISTAFDFVLAIVTAILLYKADLLRDLREYIQ
ncbi:MAG: hypothetical protein ACFFCX_00250 [Candidatus Sifarchaeia archaeon]